MGCPRFFRLIIAMTFLAQGCTDIGERVPMPPAKQPSAAPPLAGQPAAVPLPSPDDHDASRAPAEPPIAAREPIGPLPPEAAPPLVSVVGRSEAEIVRLLGAPSSETVEPPAKKLTFAAEACSLEVYLFPEMAQGGFRALDEKATGSLPVAQCLAQLRAAHGTGGQP
jgi:hypothetical protein